MRNIKRIKIEDKNRLNKEISTSDKTNTLDNYDTSNFLGYDINSFANDISYTKKTITAEERHSEGKHHSNIWTSIMTKDDFRNYIPLYLHFHNSP